MQNFLFTLNTRFIAKDSVVLAVTTSFLATVVTMLVIYDVLTRLDSQESIIDIVTYALGISTGTFFAVKFKLGLKK